MRSLAAVLLSILACWTASSQTYTISTFAGGGAPVNIPGTSANLALLSKVAVDAQGNIFFVDGLIILRLDATTGILTLVAGNGTDGFSGDNGPATSAQLSYSSGIAVDSAENVYIADSHNNCVRKVSNGIITTVAGNGLPGFSGDGGPAAEAQLNEPWGIVLDTAGNLYIADSGNQRVREVANGVIATIAGNGISGFSGDGGQATKAELSGPTAVALDSSGNLYIAAAGNERIRKISAGVITTVAGSGMQGFSGDGGPATSAELNNPESVAVDSAGNVYIADTQNSVIRKVSNGTITTFAGNGKQGFSGDNGSATSAELDYPQGVAVDAFGNLIIADSGNRVRRISAGIITTLAGDGLPPIPSGDNGPATNAQLVPSGVAMDSSGNLFISGNQEVRKVTAGVITTVAGTGTAGFNGESGPAAAIELNGPAGIAVDSAGNLYIADSENNRVRKVSNGVMSTFAGSNAVGYPGAVGDGGAAVDAVLNNPAGVAVDSGGNVYIADTGDHRVRKVSSGMISTVAGNGMAGSSGDNGPATAAEVGPAGIAVDSGGNFYIVSYPGIREIADGIITTVAGSSQLPLFSGDGGLATNATFNNPNSVALDSAGNLYVTDTENYRVRKVTNGVISTIAGNGTLGFSGDNGPATSAEISQPLGVAVDSSGNVYFADPNNDRVRLLTPGTASTTVQKPVIQSVVNAVDYSGMVAPGAWVAMFGSNLSPSTSSASGLPLPTELAGVTVTIVGTTISLPLRYVSPGQINALLPFGPPGNFQFVVSTPAGTSSPYQIALNTVAPAVYTINASGTGPAFAFDPGFSEITAIGTAPLVLYASGLGPTNPPGNAALGGSAIEPYNSVANTVSVQIGGQPAHVLFAGLAPGLPGVYQLNVDPPQGTPSDNSLVVSVTLPGESTVSSGATTLPVAAGGNTANVTGAISQLYPVNGTSLGFSALLTVANFSAAFDIVSGAQPFNLSATCAGGSETVSFDPAAGTWQAALTVPTTPARAYNFSTFSNAGGLIVPVIDFATGLPFAGNIVPLSLVDPAATAALASLPGPNSTTGAPNATYTAQGAIPASGHVVIGASALSELAQFGGFVTAPAPTADLLTRRASCTLSVDGMLVSSVLVAFN